MLVSIYENIRGEPFKKPEDDGNDLMHTFFNPDREGWLWKQGGRVKSWKRRSVRQQCDMLATTAVCEKERAIVY